jgi:hypothetical protein
MRCRCREPSQQNVNTEIEIHDSRVIKIDESDGVVIVHFKPAYLHKSEGRSGINVASGWVQEAKLIFSDATIHGDFSDWPCDLIDGEIIINGARHDNSIPVPLESSGHIEARFVCDEIHVMRIAGCEVRLDLIGEPKFVEGFNPPSSSI